MRVGFVCIEGYIPFSLRGCLPPQVSKLILFEHYNFESIAIVYAHEQNIPLTILPTVHAFTEQDFYTLQIDKLVPLCDLLICFAQKDCEQLQWCLDYAEQRKIDIVVHKGIDNT